MGYSGPKWLGAAFALALFSLSATSQAAAETRSLKLYFIHTKERAEITYKRNGRYIQSGLDQINRFLRDWRQDESAKMDPRLLDLVWQVYQSVGARDYIHVVSAYRSPETNAMLRSRSSGVAKKSQHMLGKAMDFYIPGVKLSKLRAAAFKAEGGGVGYYPNSGAPFVHLDTGNVRSWPRMSRGELLALFPDGKTIHLPSDGKPLPGYKQALAAYEARKKSGGSIAIARDGSGSGRGFLAALFGGGADEEEDNAEAAAPVVASAAPRASEPRRQQPQQAVPETPETILAALPARSVPIPLEAPRPSVDVGAPSAVAAAASQALANAATLPTEPGEEVVAPVEVAVNVPLPSWRPDYQQAAPDVDGEALAQLAAAGSDLPVAAIAGSPAPSVGSEAIKELLAMSAAEARADVVINEIPLPAPRKDKTLVASLGTDDAAAVAERAGGEVFVLASLPTTGSELVDDSKQSLRPGGLDADPKARLDRLPPISASASPRAAVVNRPEGKTVMAALDSGVRTTEKSRRPEPSMAREEPQAVVLPVAEDLTRWALQPEATALRTSDPTLPAMVPSELREAPSTVYTAGFDKDREPVVANRLSGKAVVFLSVARFETN